MIRPMRPGDRETYYRLATAFYRSDAISSPPDEEKFRLTFDEITRGSPYLEGYMLEKEGEPVGYGMLAKYFSPEAGGLVVWVDELFLLPHVRGQGVGSAFFRFVKDKYQNRARAMRLEVDRDNERAISFYRSMGFRPVPYRQMTAAFPDKKE